MASLITPSTTNPAKKQNPRGSSFTPVEDETIAKAYAAASGDPFVGKEQKGNDFFLKTQKLYNYQFKPANRENRSMMSVKTRCKAIHKECMIFSGCHARVTRAHPTYVSSTDIVNMATALYNGVDVERADDDCGKPFKYQRAWNILQRPQKFLIAADKLSSVSMNNRSTEQSNQSAATSMRLANGEKDSNGASTSPQRPTSRKRSKEQKFKEEATSKKLRLPAQSVAAQQERNEALRRHYEIRPFSNAPAGFDDSEAVEYFKIMRSRALVQLRREEQGKGRNETNEDIEASSNDE